MSVLVYVAALEATMGEGAKIWVFYAQNWDLIFQLEYQMCALWGLDKEPKKCAPGEIRSTFNIIDLR